MTPQETEGSTVATRNGISAATALWLGLLGAAVVLILLHVPLFGAEISPRQHLTFLLASFLSWVTGAPSYRVDLTPLLALVLLYTVGHPVWKLWCLQRPAPRKESELHLEEEQIRQMAHAGGRPWDPVMATPGGSRAVLDLLVRMSSDTPDTSEPLLGAAVTAASTSAIPEKVGEDPVRAETEREAAEREEAGREGSSSPLDPPGRPAAVYTPTSLYTSPTFPARSGDRDEEEL